MSTLIGLGWAMAACSAAMTEVGYLEHCFRLQKGRENRILRVRKKMLGNGVVAEELDV